MYYNIDENQEIQGLGYFFFTAFSFTNFFVPRWVLPDVTFH